MSRSHSSSISGTRAIKFINEKEYMTIIYENFFNDKYELCGNITINGNEFIDIDYNTIDEKERMEDYKKSLSGNTKNKLYCVHMKYSDVMWHTHPSIVYPSIQDVAFVLKRNTVSYSYIISKIGYFRITALTNKPIILTQEDTDNLTRTLHEYYFLPETEKGRVYHKEHMNTYIRHLNNKFNHVLKNYDDDLYFQIKFYQYK